MSAYRARLLMGFIVLFILSILAIAYFAEYKLNMIPCPFCLIQRFLFAAIGVVMLCGLCSNGKLTARRISAFITLVLCAIGITVAARHLYLQSLPSDLIPTCSGDLQWLMHNFPLTEVWQMLWEGSADCASSDDKLWGVSFVLWSLFAYLFLVLASLVLFFGKNSPDINSFSY